VLGLELVVILGLALLGAGLLARRLHVAPPVPQLALGILIGFVPALRGVQLPPEIVLLLFLPALLYWESLSTSLHMIRSNLRIVVLMATVLVLATAAAAAVAGHGFGLPWGPAWVLGAAIAPTDATAVGVLARALPRRTMSVLKAESLVNDGTALVIYGLAIGITVGEERLTAPHVTWLVVVAYGGGTLAGVIVAYAGMWIRRRLTDPLLENVAVVVIPFAAYLLAESMEASGVFAVVICGLIISQAGPRVGHAATRQQATAFWTLATYLLNGALFVLIGIQVQSSVRGLTSATLTQGLLAVGVVSAAVVGARLLWLFTTPYIIRTLDRRPLQRARRVGARPRLVNGVAGFRGAVSLAAALAVPHTVSSGAPFPGRDRIIFIVTGVIVVTLVGQALLLPVVIRWARLPPDDADRQERRLADRTATQEALAALPRLAAHLRVDPEVRDRVQQEFEQRIHVLHADEGDGDDDDEGAARHDQQYTALRRAAIAHKRATVLRLRDEGRIDDGVMRRVQNRLDFEEMRLGRPRA
jgi:Na+/H+ antiporter